MGAPLKVNTLGVGSNPGEYRRKLFSFSMNDEKIKKNHVEVGQGRVSNGADKDGTN